MKPSFCLLIILQTINVPFVRLMIAKLAGLEFELTTNPPISLGTANSNFELFALYICLLLLTPYCLPAYINRQRYPGLHGAGHAFSNSQP